MSLDSTLYRALGQDRRDADRTTRAMAFEERMRKYPGAAPNGTGPTGLMSGDARGYSEMLEEQQNYLQETQRAAGRAPMSIRSAPIQERHVGGEAMPQGSPFAALQRRMGVPSGEDAFAAQAAADEARNRNELGRENVRGARIRNTVASNQAAASTFDPFGDNEFDRKMDRAGVEGEFSREQAQAGFKQKLAQYFDPAHQGMLDDTARRQTEPELEKERIRGMYGVMGDEATARGRVDEARVDAAGRPQPAEQLLDSETFITGVMAAMGKDRAEMTEGDRAQMELLYRALNRGNGAQDGGGDPNKVISRAEVEQYARETRQDPAAAAAALQGKGYVIR